MPYKLHESTRMLQLNVQTCNNFGLIYFVFCLIVLMCNQLQQQVAFSAAASWRAGASKRWACLRNAADITTRSWTSRVQKSSDGENWTFTSWEFALINEGLSLAYSALVNHNRLVLQVLSVKVIIVSKMMSHCVGTVQMREESESRMRTWKPMWFIACIHRRNRWACSRFVYYLWFVKKPVSLRLLQDRIGLSNGSFWKLLEQKTFNRLHHGCPFCCQQPGFSARFIE